MQTFSPIIAILFLFGGCLAHISWKFHGDASSDSVIRNFEKTVAKAIESREASKIAALFDDQFSIQGCHGSHGKADVVEALSTMPREISISATVLSSRYLTSDIIQYTARIGGLNEAHTDIEFKYLVPKGVLISGRILECPKRNFVSENAAGMVVTGFLNRMGFAIRSRDASELASLFVDSFMFKGCTRSYGKHDVLQILSQLPSGTPFHFTLKSAVYVTASKISYTVLVDGFGGSPIETMMFTYCTVRSALVDGKILQCPARQFYATFAQETADAVVKGFLNRMTKAIDSKDSTGLSELFTENFSFKGCRGNYNKNQIVDLLGKYPFHSKFSFVLKSASYSSADEIEYTVTVSGFTPSSFDAKFTLSVSQSALTGGSVPTCSARRFLVLDTAETVVNRFLERLTKTLSTRKRAAFSNLFAFEFSFQGCRGTYNKDHMINGISHLPTGTQFHFILNSAKYISSDNIECVVSISGFGPSPIKTQFHLSVGRGVLTQGNILSCPSRRFLNFWGQ